ncbi:MAG: efflux transporter outer membrane subunit [Steroidobacteraceae bacterium]
MSGEIALKRRFIAVRSAGLLGVAVALAAGPGCLHLHSAPSSAQLAGKALPHMQVPAQWIAQGTSPEAVQSGWLNELQDPALEALAAEALAYNPDLQVAQARVEQSRSLMEAAGGALQPTLTAAGKTGGKLGGDASGVSGAFLLASWELDVWGRIRYGRMAASAQYSSAVADAAYARQSLVASLARAWFGAKELTAQIQLTQKSIESAQQLLTLTQVRARVGTANTGDVAAAEAALAGYQDSLRELIRARAQAQRALETLLGRYPAAELAVSADLPPAPPPAAAGIPSQLLERRPDVIAAQQRVAVAFARTEEASAARFPQISLTAAIGTISSEVFLLKNVQNPLWSVGAEFAAPIWNGGRLQAAVSARAAEQQAASADFARIGARSFADVENAIDGEAALRERAAYAAAALEAQRRALGVTEVEFRVGRTDERPVVQQQLRVRAAEMNALHIHAETLSQRVMLHLALGGDFGAAAAPSS